MKWIRMIALVGSLAVPAVATESEPAASLIPAEQAAREAGFTDEYGYRISVNDEFALVEHGHWRPPLRPTMADSPARPSLPVVPDRSQKRPPKKMSNPNFRRAAFLPHVYAAEAKFGLPPGLLDAVIWTESRYNPVAVSRAGAAGLGQLMPGTAKEMGVFNRFDPHANILGAAGYLRQMLDRFGMVHLALAAYNAGPGTVSRVRGVPLNGETPGYVRGVLDRWARK